METAEIIPVEIRARVAANIMFDAILTGDYTTAATAQNRLRDLGWHVSREPVTQRRSQRLGAQKTSNSKGDA
jgi:hypothetical protein